MGFHIMFEGAEAVGKSTIVAAVAEHFSAEVHKGVRVPNRLLMLNKVVNDVMHVHHASHIDDDTAVTLYDRHQLVSDIVYEEHCYDTKSIISPLLPHMCKSLGESKFILVYVRCEKNEMLNRFNYRGDKLRSTQQAARVFDAYEQFMAIHGDEFNRIVIDTTGCNPEEKCNQTIALLEQIMKEWK